MNEPAAPEEKHPAMTQFKVPDGQRELRFEGVHLSHASGRQPHSPRWAEFDLYRTRAGKYIVVRTGHSLIYHQPGCAALRSVLASVPAAVLVHDAVPCEMCDPQLTSDDQLVQPEVTKHFAQECRLPEHVLTTVERRNTATGNPYLTRVAQALLHEAALHDEDIANIFRVHVVP